MSNNLHVGIALDEKFSKTIGKIKDSMDVLDKIVADFEKNGLYPTASQLSYLTAVCASASSIEAKFKNLDK